MRRQGAEEKVAKACMWVARNPAKWDALRRMCRDVALEGAPVMRGALFERARALGLDVSEASQYRRDHNLWSVLARYMAMEDPSLLRALSFRESDVDEVDLVAAWRGIVGEPSFAARSLAEARLLFAEAAG